MNFINEKHIVFIERCKNAGKVARLVEHGARGELEAHAERITEENAEKLLAEADIICEAFDNPECKATLTDAVLSKMPEKYLVAASGMAGTDSPNTVKTRKLTDRFYLCGDGVSDVATAGSLVSARVMLCAAHEALTVLRILANEFEV